MSEYQRYEFMTCDNPLTPAQRAAVNKLSSHIDVSSTRAVVDYEWGDFKHDPIKVLHDYFDGFLYWANWGAPRLAFRFSHALAPFDLFENYVNQYDLEEVVTLSQAADYDVLDIHFSDLEGPDEWVDYELEPLLGLREELLDGDLRALYIVWLAAQHLYASYARDKGADAENIADTTLTPPLIPPGLNNPSPAHRALATLLQIPDDLLTAVGRHSSPLSPSAAPDEDIMDLLDLLPPERAREYLARLAHNEPQLSRLLARELRKLSLERQQDIPVSDQKTLPLSDVLASQAGQGERFPYTSLFAESVAIRALQEREKQEKARQARERQLQYIHGHQDEYWAKIDADVERGSGVGYQEATDALIELREVAAHFNELELFNAHFQVWVHRHLSRPALVRRLREQRFPLPADAK